MPAKRAVDKTRKGAPDLNAFFAFVFRMKHIARWSLMHNHFPESLAEHSLNVAMLSHALALIGNRYLGASHNAERAAALALYHDAEETITGDMPTPVKYFSGRLRSSYGEIEEAARRRLLEMLPPALCGDYRGFFEMQPEDKALWKLVKAADVLAALIKCIEEARAGNREFIRAEASTREKLAALSCPEAEKFCELFLPAFSLSLDELHGSL